MKIDYSALYYSLPGIAILIIAGSAGMIRHTALARQNEMFAGVISLGYNLVTVSKAFFLIFTKW